MPALECDGRRIEIREGETVLEALLREGRPVPNACRAGACQSCLVRATEGAPPATAQAGLKETLKAQGFFLSCVARLQEPLSITLLVGPPEVRARVAGVEELSASVLRVRLTPLAPFLYESGQFVTLVREDGLARSYSLASLPDEETLELHVRLIPGGRMSGWLSGWEAEGSELAVRGPAGECFYTPGRPEQPLLLVGTGTGLAPLYGILRTALRAGHRGPIHLFHGTATPAGGYLVDELLELGARHANFAYHRCVLEGDGTEGVEVGALDRIVAERLPSLRGHRAYLCGDPGLVATLRRKVFLAGAAMAEIHADAFVPAVASPDPQPA